MISLPPHNCIFKNRNKDFKKVVLKYAGIFLALFLFFISCKPQVSHPARQISRSFYYWKSVFAISAYEKQQLDALKINTLYIKFFDVDWNETTRQPGPVVQLRIADKTFFLKNNFQIIPTIFITNECLYKMDASQCAALAANILALVNNMVTLNKINTVLQIQIDCDWTAETKEKYFSILTKLQSLDSAHSYSVTIRLHQIKYLHKTGVPPVSRGLLMCYNMGNLKSAATNNAILDVEELLKYTASISSYPLPLDVALPLFNWYVLFKNGSYAGLIQDVDNDMLKGISKKTAANRFEIITDTLLNHYDFKKGDILRFENSEYTEIIKAAKILSQKIKDSTLHVSLYHLDSLILKKYSTNEIENIFNSLH